MTQDRHQLGHGMGLTPESSGTEQDKGRGQALCRGQGWHTGLAFHVLQHLAEGLNLTGIPSSWGRTKGSLH